MDLRHAVVLLGVIGCAGRVVAHTSIVLDGPTVAAESLHVAATDSTSGIAARIVSDRGALDFLDGGGDVLITNRRAAIAYAATRADYATIPLPWDRQYVLVAASAPPVGDMVDAVHADARAPSSTCAADSGGATLPRIAYAADDSIARALAERLAGSGAALRAAAVSHPTIEPAYITARPIGDVGCDIGGKRVVPLVETRSELIVRRGAVGVVADSAGHLRLTTVP